MGRPAWRDDPSTQRVYSIFALVALALSFYALRSALPRLKDMAQPLELATMSGVIAKTQSYTDDGTLMSLSFQLEGDNEWFSLPDAQLIKQINSNWLRKGCRVDFLYNPQDPAKTATTEYDVYMFSLEGEEVYSYGEYLAWRREDARSTILLVAAIWMAIAVYAGRRNR